MPPTWPDATARSDHNPERDVLIARFQAETGIDVAMVDRLVRAFYTRARDDEMIGPVFNTHVPDWEAHFRKLTDFWSSVTLMSGRYHGQPMRAHFPLGLNTLHFARWLALFEQTAKEVCPPAAAAAFIERAQRIAQSMAMGMAVARGELPVRRPPSSQQPN